MKKIIIILFVIIGIGFYFIFLDSTEKSVTVTEKVSNLSASSELDIKKITE